MTTSNDTQTIDKGAKAKADRQAEVISMSDGRSVEFVGKRKMLKESLFDDAGNWTGTRFDFRDGSTFLFDTSRLPTTFSDGGNSLGVLAAHGLEQKLGDETAGTEKVGDMYLDVEVLGERLYAGEWSKERAAGGGMGGTSILIRALVESSGKPVEAIKAFLKTKDKAAKDAMRASDRLRPIVQRLEAEDAAKVAHVDTATLFGELDKVETASDEAVEAA